MIGYLLRVWCDDCCDEDPQGCFDGGVSVVGVGIDDVPFDTYEAAESAGWRMCSGPPWSFEVFEVKS